MKLQPKLQLCEYLLGFSMIAQTFFSSWVTPCWAIVGFILFSVAKHYLEGFRVSYILFTIAQLALLISNHLFYRLIILATVYFILTYFPIYEYPNPSGKFKIGYRRFALNNGKVSGCIYYPTHETTSDVNYAHNTGAWQRFAEIIIFYARVRKSRHLPKFFYKLIFSVFDHQYLGVNLNSKLAKTDDDSHKFPVMVFSHGLAGHIHAYSIQIKEWVSHGYIVFSVDHDEDIFVPVKSHEEYDEYVRLRAEQLAPRNEAITEVLNHIHDSKKVEEIFEEKVPVDHSKIVLGGHSFGGATACEVAFQDKRVTGGLLLLDPWLAPCNEKTLGFGINKPILLIRSETFALSERFKGEPSKYVKANDQGEGLVVSGYFKGSTHHCSSDLMLHLPREMVMFKMLKALEDLPNQMHSQMILTRVFLQTVGDQPHFEKLKKAKSFKSSVLENFRDHLKAHARKDLWEVDELFDTKL